MCKDKLLDELPQERIYEEFKKLFLKAEKISVGLEFLKKVDGFLYFNELKVIENIWDKTLRYIDNVNKDVLDNNTNITVMLAILCYEMDQKSCESFLNKIISKKSISKAIEHIHHINKFLDNKIDYIDHSISKDIDVKSLEIYLDAKEFDKGIIKKVKQIKPIVQGRDLLDVGFKGSKDFKDLLQLIYEVQINSLFEK
jgi:tRNA nucleotidyltransferase (CCA-adding enzyme)